MDTRQTQSMLEVMQPRLTDDGLLRAWVAAGNTSEAIFIIIRDANGVDRLFPNPKFPPLEPHPERMDFEEFFKKAGEVTKARDMEQDRLKSMEKAKEKSFQNYLKLRKSRY